MICQAKQLIYQIITATMNLFLTSVPSTSSNNIFSEPNLTATPSNSIIYHNHQSPETIKPTTPNFHQLSPSHSTVNTGNISTLLEFTSKNATSIKKKLMEQTNWLIHRLIL